MNAMLKMLDQAKKLYYQLCKDLLQKYQITRTELDILLFLYNNPKWNSARDIVEKRGIVKSHVSLGIEKLVSKNYIKAVQDHQDKRKYRLYILEDAKNIIEDGLMVQKQFNKMIWSGLTNQEKKEFQLILRHIYHNMEEGVVSCMRM